MQYGQILATRGVADDMEEDPRFRAELAQAFAKYQGGDWGVVCREDWQQNDESLISGDRILAAYETSHGRIWIITEAEDDNGRRSATTFLYPSEY